MSAYHISCKSLAFIALDNNSERLMTLLSIIVFDLSNTDQYSKVDLVIVISCRHVDLGLPFDVATCSKERIKCFQSSFCRKITKRHVAMDSRITNSVNLESNHQSLSKNVGRKKKKVVHLVCCYC
jgi:hypothetical protein